MAEQAEPTPVAVPKEDKSPEDKPKEKKEKKKDAAAAESGGKKKEKASAPPAGGKAVAEDAGEPVPSMIDMRIGHIIDGKLVPALEFKILINNFDSKKAP